MKYILLLNLIVSDRHNCIFPTIQHSENVKRNLYTARNL